MPAGNLPVVLRFFDAQEFLEFVDIELVGIGGPFGPGAALVDPVAFRGDIFERGVKLQIKE